MPAWEIFGEDLLWIEVYCGFAFIFATAAWVIFRKIPIAYIALLLTCGVLAAGAFRPFNYNSDTENYYSYVYTLSFVNNRDIFFLTKLEPVHSLLILLVKNFNSWLIIESIIEIIGLYLSYKVKRNNYSFICLCAFVLTLSTSSLRYCSALIYFFFFISKKGDTLIKAAKMTIILSCLHISMLLSGALASRKRYIHLGIAGLSLLILFRTSLLGDRADIDLSEASQGLKSLAAALLIFAYLLIRSPRISWARFPFYLGTIFSVFLVSLFVLPTFNRFLIMMALALLVNEWSTARGDAEDDIFDRGLVMIFSIGVVLPYVAFLPRLYFSGLW